MDNEQRDSILKTLLNGPPLTGPEALIVALVVDLCVDLCKRVKALELEVGRLHKIHREHDEVE